MISIQAQEDFTDDTVSSDAFLFHEQNFNMDDFVTVDEVGDEVEDTSPKPHSSSSSSSRARRERQSSDVSSSSQQTSTRSSKNSKSSSSLSFSSSKSNKGSSNSSSVSPKKSTDSSEPTKSPTKPSSSARVSKPSSSSPPPTETPSSPGQKTQRSKSEPPAKAANTASSSVSTRSSSIATVEASIETHPEQLREEAKNADGVVTKSDHKEEAEGTAAKTVKSETNIDTSSFNDNTLKEQKKSTEEGKKNYVHKHTEEEEDNSGNYQILDDQTDEQMDDGDQDGSSDTQRTGPEESFQVLDSVDDEGKTRQEEEIGTSFQELGSVPENQAASGQEDSRRVQDDGSTVKQQSEGDEIPVVDKSDDKSADKDAGGKDPDASNEDNLQVLDTHIAECCKDSKDVEIPNEDQPFQHLDNKDDSKDPDSDVPKQETFEILDSIDDQTATEDDSETLKTPSDHISEKHNGPKEEEDEDTYQVIDSLEDQPETTEIESETDNKEKRTKNGRMTARKDDGPSKRSDPTAIASKSEEKEKSPRKSDKVVKKYDTRRKMDTTAGVSKKDKEINEATEEMVYEIVDSVEDEPVQVATTERLGRRRSARGKKEDKMSSNLIEASETLVGDEEAPYKILDSVEDETVDDEPTVTTRSTRGKRTSKKDALIEKTKNVDIPTRRRQTPARESQERNREETPKKEGKEPPKESTPTKKSDTVVREDDATYEILDSVEDEVVKDDRPTTGRKGKRGRPRKEVKKTKNDSVPLKKDDKDASEKVAEEEEATYQILDSVEDETVDDQRPTGRSESSRKQDISKNDDKQTKNSESLTGSTKNEEEQEEPMYQILDSLEDDQEELTATEVPDGRNKQSIEEASAENDDTPTVEEASKTVIVTEESLYEIVDDLEEVNEEPSAAEGSGTRDNESTSGTDIKKEDKSTTKSQSDTATPEEEDKLKSPEKNTTSTLVNLDEVSEEEEDYPDDTAEEEELRKRQAATKEKQERETKMRVERRTKERERRSRSSNSRGRRGRGGTRRAKEREVDEEEEEEVDAKELVTLDEVGADEAEEERAAESREGDGEITEGELQTLVTLDEFVEDEDDGKGEQSTLESRPLSQEDESADSFNPEVKISTHAFYFQTWGNFSEAL